MLSLRSIFVTGVFSVSAFAADWPTPQHDYQRSGVTSESLRPPLSETWIFESPAPPAKGWARPVNGYGAMKNKSNVDYDDAFHVTAAAGIACFASSSENRIFAIDAVKGEIIWDFFTDASPRLAPTLANGKAYAAADDGKVYCLDLKTGEQLWKFDASPANQYALGHGRFSAKRPIRSGVVVEDGVVYFSAGLFPSEGVYLFVIDAETGAELWSKPLEGRGNETPSPQGYPVVDATSIFLPSRVAPSRWSKADGTEMPFTTPIPQVKDSAYRYHNGGSYALLWDDSKIVYGQAAILGFDPNAEYKDKYGRMVKGELVFNWFNARRIVFAGEKAWVATDYHLIAVDAQQLPELARRECKAFEESYKKHNVARCLSELEQVAKFGEESERGQHILNGNLKYAMRDFEKWPEEQEELFAQFEKKTDWMLAGKFNESMILAGDVIYAGGEEGLIAVDSKSGEKIWEAETGSRVRGLAVSDQRLFVSTIDGRVRCFEPGQSSATPRQARPEIEKTLPNPDSAALADEILDGSAAAEGFCLILNGDVDLAIAIAEQTQLRIKVMDSNADAIPALRERLAKAGLNGTRITVSHLADNQQLPFAPYLFNLVIDASKSSPVPLAEVLRVTRPHGGIAYVTRDDVSPTPGFEKTGFRLTRRQLDGAQNWTHQNASPANLQCNNDERVRGPFGILWYGEPGPRERVDRHATAPMPLVVDGVMFLEGYDLLTAYDIYNGVKYWERWIPGTTRTGLPIGASNLVADEDGLFVVAEDKQCLRLDPRTGETVQTYAVPQLEGREQHHWGWIAKVGDTLFGSRSDYDEKRRSAQKDSNHAVFALDVASGETKWVCQGEGIDHDTIAIDDGRLVYIEQNLNDAEKQQALADTIHDDSVEDRKPVDRRGETIPPDLRKIVVVDAKTGKEIWSRPFNLNDITLDDRVAGLSRGVGVLSMIRDGVLVLSGHGSLGHPYQQYVKGEYARRAIYAFDIKTGEYLWGGRKNYRKRPVIIGENVYAEPHAWNLKTGQQLLTQNPLNGESIPLDFLRGYSGCGHLVASSQTLFGNTNVGGMAHFNLDDTGGYTPLGNLQLACGTNAVPAGGVFVAPEGRSGCTCSTPIYTSIVLYPTNEAADAWSFSAGGAEPLDCLPVKRVAVNLGAPGFRSDSAGQLWLPYPGERIFGQFSEWIPAYQHDASMCFRSSGDLLSISTDSAAAEWIYTSGLAHEKPMNFPMLDPDKHPAAKYTIRLHFAEPEDLKAGERVFDVSIQGNPVLEDFDIIREAGASQTAIIHEFGGIDVTDKLTIALKSKGEQKPLLCAFEAIMEKRVSKDETSLHAAIKTANPDYGGGAKFVFRENELVSVILQNCPNLHDLSPLADFPSKHVANLSLYRAGKITDLSPLRGYQLRQLNLERCADLTSLEPLAGMPLTYIRMYACSRISDLSPLKGMPLKHLDFGLNEKIADISMLEGMQLEDLRLDNCPEIKDISVVSEMPLQLLTLFGSTGIEDFSPLSGLDLETLLITPNQLSEAEIDMIRQMESLKILGASWDDYHAKQTPAQFWKRFNDGDFR